MEQIKSLVQSESRAAVDLQLNYLSKTLADALQEMDNAQENLKICSENVNQPGNLPF